MSQCVLNARIDVSVVWYEYVCVLNTLSRLKKYLFACCECFVCGSLSLWDAVLCALCVYSCICFCGCFCLCVSMYSVYVCIQRKDINGFSGPQI